MFGLCLILSCPQYVGLNRSNLYHSGWPCLFQTLLIRLKSGLFIHFGARPGSEQGDEQHSLLIIRLIPSCPPYVGLSGRFSQPTCDTNSCTTTTQIKINSQIPQKRATLQKFTESYSQNKHISLLYFGLQSPSQSAPTILVLKTWG